MGFNSADPVVFESVSNVTATKSVELGTRITVDGRQYCYVYNAGNSQLSVGQGATVTATSGYSVTVSSTTQVDAFVGVCYHATLPTGYYGWLLTKGAGKVVAPAGSALVAGNPLYAGADGVWSPLTTTVTGIVQAKCTVGTASAGVGEAYVSCLY